MSEKYEEDVLSIKKEYNKLLSDAESYDVNMDMKEIYLEDRSTIEKIKESKEKEMKGLLNTGNNEEYNKVKKEYEEKCKELDEINEKINEIENQYPKDEEKIAKKKEEYDKASEKFTIYKKKYFKSAIEKDMIDFNQELNESLQEIMGIGKNLEQNQNTQQTITADERLSLSECLDNLKGKLNIFVNEKIREMNNNGEAKTNMVSLQ